MLTTLKKTKAAGGIRGLGSPRVYIMLFLFTSFIGAQVYLFLEYLFNW